MHILENHLFSAESLAENTLYYQIQNTLLIGLLQYAYLAYTTPKNTERSTPEPEASLSNIAATTIIRPTSQEEQHELDAYLTSLEITCNYFLDTRFITPEALDKIKKSQYDFFTQKITATSNSLTDVSEAYKKHLETLLLKHLRSFNPIKNKKKIKKTSRRTAINTSLAYLWLDYYKQESPSDLVRFLNESSDAHGLIQFIGWSTQNENSLLAILDVYNYNRYRGSVAEANFILQSLIAPFYPIFTEYQDIARREKNAFFKSLRTAIPMLITAGFVIGVTALIPFALPELAFLILAIPLLYLGFGVASLYLKTKSIIYQNYRQLRYTHDMHDMPEFQLDENLQSIFGKDLAQNIRDFYVDAIQHCTDIEKEYKERPFLHHNVEGEQRKANIQRSNLLLLEWFDLRDNPNLYANEKILIARERFEEEFNAAIKQDTNNIKMLTQDMLDSQMGVFAALMQRNTQEEREEEVGLALELDLELDKNEIEKNLPQWESTTSPCFFPSCFKQRERILKLQTLENDIETSFEISLPNN